MAYTMLLVNLICTSPRVCFTGCASIWAGVYQKLCTVGCGICPAIKNVGENRGDTEVSLVAQDVVAQDAAHKEFCCTFPLYRPSRSLEQFRTQGLKVCSHIVLNLHRDKNT